MTTDKISYSFGPVPSRRLGKSLGINNIPAKTCSYACVYCQVGRTTRMDTERKHYFNPKDIYNDVESKLEKAKTYSEQVDFITFVPDGEPTLDLNLGKTIELLKKLNVPIGVITNSTLLWREDVRDELSLADWVSVKIDAVQEPIWKKINRPHKLIKLSLILSGIIEFAAKFNGKLVTETMLVSGINDKDDLLKETSRFLKDIPLSTVYLSIPTRPPEVKSIHPPAEDVLNRAFQIFAEKIENVEYLIGYEGDAFAFTGDIEQDLLNITAVHPMRKQAVDALLFRAGFSWNVIERMISQGKLKEVSYEGKIFYLRTI